MKTTAKILALSLLPVLVAGGALRAGEAAPQGRARALADAVRQGEVEPLMRFFEQHLTPAKWASRSIEEWRQLASRLATDLAGFELDGVDVEAAGEVSISGRTAAGTTVTVIMELEAQAPHRIESLGIELGPPARDSRWTELPSPALHRQMSDEEIAASLERYFRELADQDLYSGAALLARRGKPFFTIAVGLADRRHQVPNRTDTRFNIGSINKHFTRVALARLLAEGRLRLADRIVDHLPDYPNRQVAESVTIEQLLEHTSGLGDIFNEHFFRSSKALYRAPRDYFPLFVDEPLQFAPGSGRSYSNAGYIVLGAIIETVSDETYADYVRQHVFEPAGMTASGFYAVDEPVPNVASGYTRWSAEGPSPEAPLRSNVLLLSVQGSPAGGAYSTVEDLLRFDNAIREHRLTSPIYSAWIYGGPLAAGAEPKAGERLESAVAMAGGAPGVSAVIESDGELAVILLANLDDRLTEEIALRIRRGLRSDPRSRGQPTPSADRAGESLW